MVFKPITDYGWTLSINKLVVFVGYAREHGNNPR